MARVDDKNRVLEQWLELPESRRQYATDVVAFTYRLLQERPELIEESRQTSFEIIVGWLMPHLALGEERGG